jgi:hypothetical protein
MKKKKLPLVEVAPDKRKIGERCSVALGSALPVCRHCGASPEWKQRDEACCSGWSTDHHLWLECLCGIRTVSREISYNRERHEAALVAIFNGPNA